MAVAARNQDVPRDDRARGGAGAGPGLASPWLETRHLVTLCAIAEERSFRGAAERLGYTQSAVSQQIAVLERRVGARLFDRSPAGVVAPTPAGETLVRHAQDIVARLRVAHSELQGELLAPGTAVTRVVTSAGPAAALAAEIVAVLAEHGSINARWDAVGTSSEVGEAVASGRAEFGVAEVAAANHPDVEVLGAIAVPLHFVWDQRARAIRRFEPSVLAGQPLTGYRGCSATRAAIRSLQRNGIEPSPLILSDDAAVITSLVARGAVALAPASSISAQSPRVKVASGYPPAQLAVVKHADREPTPESMHALLEVLRQRSARHAEPVVAPGRLELIQPAARPGARAGAAALR